MILGSQNQSMTRERSFIETNFVETLKQPQIQVQTPPQRIMGSPASSASSASPAAMATQKMAERLEEKAANIAQGKCFTYVTKTIANSTRKPGDYNGTIVFEIDIMKNSSPLNLKLTFFAPAMSKPI